MPVDLTQTESRPQAAGAEDDEGVEDDELGETLGLALDRERTSAFPAVRASLHPARIDADEPRAWLHNEGISETETAGMSL